MNYSSVFCIGYCRLGIKHVKGMLLFGPPGTGKTLMARQIGKMLNGKDPKVYLINLCGLLIFRDNGFDSYITTNCYCHLIFFSLTKIFETYFWSSYWFRVNKIC